MNRYRGIVALYGLLDIINGVQGFVAMGKLPWLVWNSCFGAFAILGALVAARRPRLGFSMTGAVAALDVVFFGLKAFKEPQFWPNLLITAAAAAALVCSARGALRTVQ